MNRYGADEESAEGTINHRVFPLNGQDFFMVMDSSRRHNFSFTPSMSLFVNCD
jgi:predicted 3-demethylubiquinone-9 3-methyltransferase (glyoxalase superfamily)